MSEGGGETNREIDADEEQITTPMRQLALAGLACAGLALECPHGGVAPAAGARVFSPNAAFERSCRVPRLPVGSAAAAERLRRGLPFVAADTGWGAGVAERWTPSYIAPLEPNPTNPVAWQVFRTDGHSRFLYHKSPDLKGQVNPGNWDLAPLRLSCIEGTTMAAYGAAIAAPQAGRRARYYLRHAFDLNPTLGGQVRRLLATD